MAIGTRLIKTLSAAAGIVMMFSLMPAPLIDWDVNLDGFSDPADAGI